ncbi:MAG: hypothetical protein P1V81_14100 [Planctomycetota bacterium]|nr:hypothetical protein [Planctomycetota bacterium]
MALAENESKSAIILIGVGLLAVAGAAFGTFVGLGRAIDGGELLAERFACTELPLELEVDSAHKLGSGDRIARLVAEEGVERDPSWPDNVIVQLHKDDRAPGLMFPPEPRSVDLEKLGRWEQDPQQVFRGEINRGRVDFGRWSVPYIRERLFRDTGAWVDSMRVNLSSEDVNCVVFAEFPPEVEGSEDALRLLLDGFELR